MKKILTTILISVSALFLIACGSEEELPIEKADVSVETKETESKNETEKVEEIEFEEMVLIDTEDCLMKVTGIKPNGDWGFTLDVFVENKTSDANMLFITENGYINGLSCDPLWGAEVAPGKKQNTEMSFSTELPFGISDYTDIEIELLVQDNQNWDGSNFYEGTVHVYPYGEEKAQTYLRESEDTDTVLLSNEYVDVIMTDIDPENMWGYTLNLYILNKTDYKIMLATNSVSVNGYMLDPFYGIELGAGKAAFSSISWFEEDFTTNGIEEVENIELYFDITNNETWNQVYSSDAIIIEP